MHTGASNLRRGELPIPDRRQFIGQKRILARTKGESEYMPSGIFPDQNVRCCHLQPDRSCCLSNNHSLRTNENSGTHSPARGGGGVELVPRWAVPNRPIDRPPPAPPPGCPLLRMTHTSRGHREHTFNFNHSGGTATVKPHSPHPCSATQTPAAISLAGQRRLTECMEASGHSEKMHHTTHRHRVFT